jgi:hypothetical protein
LCGISICYIISLPKTLPCVSISLTSGIRTDGGVQNSGVVHVETKVSGVQRKRCKVRAWINILGVKDKGSWHELV